MNSPISNKRQLLPHQNVDVQLLVWVYINEMYESRGKHFAMDPQGQDPVLLMLNVTLKNSYQSHGVKNKPLCSAVGHARSLKTHNIFFFWVKTSHQ